MNAPFRHVPPDSIDREQYLLWCGSEGTTLFAGFAEAVEYFTLDFASGRDPHLYRFNPAYPEETRDITQDAIKAMPEDEPYAGMSEFEIAYARADSESDRRYQATRETF